MTVFAIADTPALTGEVATGAVDLAATMGTDAAVIALCDGCAEAAGRAGAGRVLRASLPDGAPFEDIVYTLADLVADDSVVLVAGDRRGRAVAGRLAAIKGTSAIADVRAVAFDGTVKATHNLYGGNVVSTEHIGAGPVILIVSPGVYEAADKGGSATAEALDVAAAPVAVKIVGTKPKQAQSADLTASKVIVCCGRGITDAAGVALAEGLAEALEGDVAFTRPLTEGADPLSTTDDYIGVSGIQAKPELYIGVGVSGQTQHLMGVVDARVIVGICKDQNAPIFRQSDYAIVGDAYEVVPAITAAIQGA